jgi:hypothetical protein
MNTERAQVGWTFWLWWILATAVGFGVGLIVGAKVGSILEAIAGPLLGSLTAIAAVGASVGTAQWFLLRRHFPGAGWWVLATTVGGIVGGLLSSELEASLGPSIVRFAVFGAPIAISQWIVLRRHFRNAGWWVLAGIVVGLWDGLAVLQAYRAFGTGVLVGFVALGVLYGAITGGVMVWLLRQPVTKEPSPPQDAE